jgi:hypothetical protein
MMISLELAQKLKAAGLKWEPMAGDSWTYINIWDMVSVINDLYDFECEVRDNNGCLYLPSLSQLLAEIEARGYDYTLYQRHDSNRASIVIYKIDPEVFNRWAVTPEEAAGLALLWILEQEGKHD